MTALTTATTPATTPRPAMTSLLALLAAGGAAVLSVVAITTDDVSHPASEVVVVESPAAPAAEPSTDRPAAIERQPGRQTTNVDACGRPIVRGMLTCE